MKLISSFTKFLVDTVNLNATRVKAAEAGIITMTDFLKKNDTFATRFVDTKPQGSYRQETIIKPADSKLDFDVDLLFELQAQSEWQPKDYLHKLSDEFRKTDRYKEKVDTRNKNRCVTIDYERDFHIDIIPAIKQSGGLSIMNKSTNQFEPTDGDGYALWFADKNRVTGGKNLVHVVRLIKYVRDAQKGFEIKSILLTTLLGNRVVSTDLVYSDLPSALLGLMTRLDEYLQANAAMPIITNPVLPAETFNRHWDQEKYEKFRKAIHQLSAIIKQAYDATDVEESVALWRKVFGEEFPLLESETGILNPESIQLSSIGDSGHQRPLSDICAGEELQYKIRIDAYLYSKNGKVKYRGINSDARFASDLAIKYVASTNVPEPYDVHWQVVNTGAHAAAENGLRGRFFKARTLQNDPSTPLINWETSKYTGKHWIECFVLKNNKCVARSGKFFINIKNPSH